MVHGQGSPEEDMTYDSDGANFEGTIAGPPGPYEPELEDLDEGSHYRPLLPGDMDEFAFTVQSRCENLKSFKLRTISIPPEPPFYTPPNWCWRGRELPDNLANFFKVIQPQEVSLIYGTLGGLAKLDIAQRYPQRIHADTNIPQLPQNVLLPVLLEGCPGLKRLQTKGGHPARFPTSVPKVDRVKLANIEAAIDFQEWETYEGQLRTWAQDYKGLRTSDDKPWDHWGVALIYGTGTVVFGTVTATTSKLVFGTVSATVIAPIEFKHHGETITNYATEI